MQSHLYEDNVDDPYLVYDSDLDGEPEDDAIQQALVASQQHFDSEEAAREARFAQDTQLAKEMSVGSRDLSPPPSAGASSSGGRAAEIVSEEADSTQTISSQLVNRWGHKFYPLAYTHTGIVLVNATCIHDVQAIAPTAREPEIVYSAKFGSPSVLEANMQQRHATFEKHHVA